uniref:Uncharacterized protein n=1 Tax=Oryza nivara TaxID=4536 RepID=A0A0E0JA23_ORYNI
MDGSASSSVVRRRNGELPIGKCPRFFMWESQYEQYLADGRVGVGHQSGRESHVEAMASMGFGVSELKGCNAVGQILVYIRVLQALLLLLILVVVISNGLAPSARTSNFHAQRSSLAPFDWATFGDL